MGYYKISSKGEKIKKFLICFLIFSLSLATVSAEKIVILAIDDFQVWWLEDVQDYVVDVHAANNIPITMGVIPAGIEDIWGGERFSSRLEEWDSKPQTEIAQHGYDHSIYLRGMSYAQQNYRINKGKDLLEDIGITPYSFIPPYGEADDTTIQVLINSGFHTFYDVIPLDLSPTSELLLLEEQLHLCKNDASGKSCEFKDYNNLKSEINEKIQEDGVALVLYHMQDFESSGGGIDTGKAAQVIGYAKKLKQEGYTLMTVEQYYQYLQYSECTIDSECGTDYDVDYCIGNEVWLDSHEFTCEIGSCNEDVTSVFQFDCGESYCEDWQYECRGNGVWRKRLCHTYCRGRADVRCLEKT